MFDQYFAAPEAGVRESIPDFLARYPGFAFDEERYEEDRAEAAYLHARLEEFTEYVEGKRRPSFVWDEETYASFARHPVYRRPEYRVAAFSELPSLTRAGLRRLKDPFDFSVAGSDIVYEDQTSGTSGAPLPVVYSARHMAVDLHLDIVKVAIRAGVTGLGKRSVFTVVATDNPASKGNILVPDPLGLVGHTVMVYVDPSDRSSLDEFDRLLGDLDPEVISSKPNLFRILLAHWERLSDDRADPPCRPLFTVSGGAMLAPEVRAGMREFFGCRMVNTYGIAEVGYLGSECPAGRIHFDESLHGAFEILPPESDEDPGDGAGELAVTSSANPCMPLLRYRVGDLARLLDGPCACGQPGPALDELRGRTTLVFDLGEGVMLSPTRFMRLFQEIPELQEYQLTQREPRAFELKIEIREDVPEQAREEAAVRVHKTIASEFPVPVDITWRNCVFDKAGAKFARFRIEVVGR